MERKKGKEIKIEKTEFGKIIVNGVTLYEDIVVDSEGKVEKRKMPKGTHIVCLEETKSLLDQNPKVFIVGTGQYGVANIEREVEEYAKQKGIEIIAKPTPEAIKTFNQTKEKKVALFHLTC